VRMMPSRLSAGGQPTMAKGKPSSQVRSIAVPLDGMDLMQDLNLKDPTACPLLDNWEIEEDRISCRDGYRLTNHVASTPIERLIPYFAAVKKLLAASGGVIYDALTNTSLKTGFTGNDWHWTMASSLATASQLAMVNGKDGYWTYDGTTFTHQTLTTGTGLSPFDPNHLAIVCNYQQRLWFADTDNLSLWYLPILNLTGQLAELPLQMIFKRSGKVAAVATWSTDAGADIANRLVVFTTNGECAVYSGVDPTDATDFRLMGVWVFPAPMSKHSTVQIGANLHVLTADGLTSMTALIRGVPATLDEKERVISSAVKKLTIPYRLNSGWSVNLDQTRSNTICNCPLGYTNGYSQFVRHEPRGVWSTFSALPSRCFMWLDAIFYFGDDSGNVWQMQDQNDNGQPIEVDILTAWSLYGTPSLKDFKMAQVKFLTNGEVHPYLEVKTDYDTSLPENQPDISTSIPGSDWDTSDWDTSDWAAGVTSFNLWAGSSAEGAVGAVRMRVAVKDCTFSVSSFNVVFEPGSIL